MSRPECILVKLSGEALGGADGLGIDPDVVMATAASIADVVRLKVSVGLVVGGGNIVRGAELADLGLDRITGDHMGMLATVINALAFRDALERQGLSAEVRSAHPIPTITAGFSAREAARLTREGVVVLFAGGTGNPLFTTDTAACLRAIEIDADLVVKATKVDGVYSEDPFENPAAERFDALSFDDVLERELGVMDLTAIQLCRDHDLPVVVCDMAEGTALTRLVAGDKVGTRIGG